MASFSTSATSKRYAQPARNLRTSSAKLPLSLLLLLISSTHAQLPYNPTHLLRSSKNNGAYVYVLEPPSTTQTQGQLLAFEVSSTLDANNLSTITVSASLPFLENDPSAAYVPTTDPDGTIVVYSGNCTLGADGSTLWRFTPGSDNATGTWTTQSYESQDLESETALSGASYLAGAFEFSANTTQADSNVYMFGGMCPSTNTCVQTWTSAATYSNTLLQFRSSNVSLLFPEGIQPIAEAGFTVTALTPNYSNASDTLIREQDFLLLGGQSGQAFINMSEVALLSLPQETWTYQDVDSPSDLSAIEPRSGHTATLTADGSKVIVIGGWVGDVSTLATPQLAILELGLGYGGLKDWSWTIPSTIGSSFTSGGIYGHGATLLDGDVVVVTGGYEISSSSSRKKRASQTRNLQNYFYNVSSKEWMSTYNANKVSSTGVTSNQTSGLNKTTSEKLGLGLGLGLGLLALMLIILAFCLFRRSRRRNRERRQEAEKIGSMSNSAYTPHEQPYQDLDDAEKDDLTHEVPAASLWDRRQRARDSWSWLPTSASETQTDDGWGSTGARDAERTGIDVNIASPTRGLRRSMYGSIGRSGYRAAPLHDEEPPTGYGNMYAIEERSEEGSTPTSRNVSANHPLPVNAPVDPFKDPEPHQIPEEGETRHTIPRKPLPQGQYTLNQYALIPPPATHASPRNHHPFEVSTWIRDWAATNVLLPHGPNNSPPKSGRTSPSKSDRTWSNLSDHFLQRTISSSSASPVRNRENRRSVRYYFPGLFDSFAGSISVASSSPSRSTFPENNSRPNTSGQRDSNSRPDTSGNNNSTSINPVHSALPISKPTDSDSFITAQSNVSYNNPASDTLLGSPSPRNKRDTILEPDTEPTFTSPGSPTGAGASRTLSRSRIGGIVGSMRRIVSPRGLKENRRTASIKATMSNEPIGDMNTLGYLSEAAETDKPHIIAPRVDSMLDDTPLSLTRDMKIDHRRSVSDGATLINPKGSIRDWGGSSSPLSSSPPAPPPHRSTSSTLGGARPLLSSPIFTTSIPVPSSPPLQPHTQAQQQDTIINRTLSPFLQQQHHRNGARSPASGRSVSGMSGNSAYDDWDVEQAVEEKVTHQVISAVPRERLRVVNSDPVVGRWESGRSGIV